MATYTGLEADTIKCIIRDGGDGIRYVCSACRYQSKANGNTSNNNSSITNVSQLFETVKSLANDVARLTQQVSLLINNNQRQTVGENSQIIDRQNLYVELREFEERKKRVNSLIVRGIDGPSDNDFAGKFGEVCLSLIGSRPEFNDIYCINRDRKLYRITIMDREKKIALLSNAKDLKNNDQFKNIYISRDLTYSQRQELRSKRAEERDRVQRGGNSSGAASLSYPNNLNITARNASQPSSISQPTQILNPGSSGQEDF